MNKETANNYLPLVKALAEGKTIQQKFVHGWSDVENPDFNNLDDCFRIKPEPRCAWANEYKDGTMGGFYPTEQKAVEMSHSPSRIVKFVEVLD